MMSLFKRTFTSLYAKIDHMVGEIENHEALIQAAIREQKKKIATAKIQLRRIDASAKEVREKIAQANIDERRWNQRAVSEAAENESRALQCLQRRKEVQAKRTQLEKMHQQYALSSDQIKNSIDRCEKDLSEMIQKHQILRARQSTAEAVSVVDQNDAYYVSDIDESFDRWEVKIAQSEHSVDVSSEIDSLEQEYLEEESEHDLRNELAELLKDTRMEEG
ncbi:hypothetical protein NBRC116494_27070 [Aurantivibrio plasticivorans]